MAAAGAGNNTDADSKLDPVVAALLAANAAPTAANDPVKRIQDIMESDLTEAQKAALIIIAQKRFENRRHMAKASFYVILLTLGLLLLFAAIDGLKTGSDVITKVGEIDALLRWILGFLTGIIAFYFGASTLRPSS